MLDKIKQLMELKKQADRIKRELDAISVECQEVKGIKIEMTGSQRIKMIDIDEIYLKPENKNKLQADLERSFNTALQKSQNMAAQKMKDVLPGGFPGL